MKVGWFLKTPAWHRLPAAAPFDRHHGVAAVFRIVAGRTERTRMSDSSQRCMPIVLRLAMIVSGSIAVLSFPPNSQLAFGDESNPTATDSPATVDEAPLDESTLRDLRLKRQEAARAFFEATKAAYLADTVTHDQWILAIRELLAADLDAATTPKERITAHARAVTAARAVEAHVTPLHEAGARGGEADKFWHSKAVRLELEIALAKEKLRQAADTARPPAKTDGTKTAPSAVPDTDDVDVAVEQLCRARLEATRRFVDASRAGFDTDTITLDGMIRANRELVAAELDAARTRADRVAAWIGAVAAARALESRVDALHGAQARGGEADKHRHAQAARREAEVELARERQQARL